VAKSILYDRQMICEFSINDVLFFLEAAMDLRNVEEFNIFMNRWEHTDDFSPTHSGRQGFTICRLSWLTNSALLFEPKCGGRREGGGVAVFQSMSTAVHMDPK
jgi:hypothetical protein